VLRAKGGRYIGILNGADYNEWNPAHDEMIATRYDSSSREGKRLCTADLRARLGLPSPEGVPIIGMITRLADQKGLDLVAARRPHGTTRAGVPSQGLDFLRG
jgi:starch synthase